MMISVEWRERAQPLAPSAVLAEGGVARSLVERLLRGGWAPELKGVGRRDPLLVVITGEAEDLPWIDGVRYFGADPAAPQVLIPTAAAPSYPMALVAARLHAGHSGLFDPSTGHLVPLHGARTLDAVRLEELIRGEEAHP